MKRLGDRLSRLEVASLDTYSHLSDEQLQVRLDEVRGQVLITVSAMEQRGDWLPDGWRDAVTANDRARIQWLRRELECAS